MECEKILEDIKRGTREIQKYSLTLLGMCEIPRTGHRKAKLQTRETLLYLEKNKEEGNEVDVELLLSKKRGQEFVGIVICARPHLHSTL